MALLNLTKLRVPDHSRYVTQPPDDVRRRALVRLYERRSAVDNLIQALERYEQERRRALLERTEFTAGEMS